jgi:hypothetical protein
MRARPIWHISRFGYQIFGIALVSLLNLAWMFMSAYADEGVHERSKCSSSESIRVDIWMQCPEETIGYPYIVCPADRRSSELTKIRIGTNLFYENWKSLHADEVKRNETIFKIISDRFRNMPTPNRNKELETALTLIEQMKARGLSWNYSIAVSPDGRYAVFATTGRKPSMLLIEVSTLTAHNLWDDYVNSTFNMPITWSPDSKYVAFAIPPPDYKVYIYDVEKMTGGEIRINEPPWVEAIAWSRDSSNLALFEWRNPRMNKNPFALLLAFAGHPSSRKDAFLSVYSVKNGEHSSVLLSEGISEPCMTRLQVEWK